MTGVTSAREPNGLIPRGFWRWGILGLLFASALMIRVYQIHSPLLDFRPIRQYRSALIARAYYYEHAPEIPAWKKDVAEANARLEGILEPPIVERIAAVGYRIFGGERLWIPRSSSVLFWLVGGVFLYLTAVRVSSRDAALFTLAFYLFLPFAIAASRSFQPDPLMVMLTILGLYLIVRHFEAPSVGGFLLAAAVTSAAILVKPVALFFILPAFLALAGSGSNAGGWEVRKVLTRPGVYLFVLLTVLPSAAYYLPGIRSSDFLYSQANSSFVPSLILELDFWKFWLKQIYSVVGFAPLILALFGLLMFPRGWRLHLMLGLWLGYLSYGLTFAHHIHTHDYYQLPFIPVVALSLGPPCVVVLGDILRRDRRASWKSAAWGIVALAILLNVGLYIREREELPEPDSRIQLAQEIGEQVEHSTRTLLLDPSGQSLRYYGEFAGRYWPDRGETASAQRYGEPPMGPEERLRSLVGYGSVDYFIITDRAEFEAQQDLAEYLTRRHPRRVETDAYIIFDLDRLRPP